MDTVTVKETIKYLKDNFTLDTKLCPYCNTPVEEREDWEEGEDKEYCSNEMCLNGM